MDQNPLFHGQKDSCAVQMKSCPAESNGSCPPTPVPITCGVCPCGVLGAQLRKAEKGEVRTKNTSWTSHRAINVVFSGEAKRRHYIYGWENHSSDGCGQIHCYK